MNALHRAWRPLGSSIAEITVGDLSVMVPDHPFWERFARGWEPDTERTLRRFVAPGSTVLDIGAWIGPTLLFSLACGAGRIVALEPNPQSHSALQKMLEFNPQLAETVTLINQAVSAEQGILSMGLAEGEDDTSTSGIMGSDFQVMATTIGDLYRDYELEHPALIKIDIEGAEALLGEDFRRLSKTPGQVIHLSVHVPFFPDSTDKLGLAEAFTGFYIEDDRGQPLSQGEFTRRLTSTEIHPDWGTKHGNFFEVLLRT